MGSSAPDLKNTFAACSHKPHFKILPGLWARSTSSLTAYGTHVAIAQSYLVFRANSVRVTIYLVDPTSIDERRCQLRYSPYIQPNIGVKDGEYNERAHAVFRRGQRSLKQMTEAHYLDWLHHVARGINWRKNERLHGTY
jgi:hypothetical protein